MGERELKGRHGAVLLLYSSVMDVHDDGDPPLSLKKIKLYFIASQDGR